MLPLSNSCGCSPISYIFGRASISIGVIPEAFTNPFDPGFLLWRDRKNKNPAEAPTKNITGSPIPRLAPRASLSTERGGGVVVELSGVAGKVKFAAAEELLLLPIGFPLRKPTEAQSVPNSVLTSVKVLFTFSCVLLLHLGRVKKEFIYFHSP
jgi:hypothetical protein